MNKGLVCLGAALAMAACGSSEDAASTVAESSARDAVGPVAELFIPPTIRGMDAYPMRATDYGYRVTNPIHGLDFHFRSNHVAVTRRDADWTWTWRLKSVGRTGSMAPARPAAPHLASCGDDCMRLEYRRGGLVEWYINTIHGVEQGFDLVERPEGTGPLVLEAEVDGLDIQSGQAADVLVFNEAGKRMFTYSKLIAYDSVGVAMPATFEFTASTVRIVVDDSGAIYPLVIDPTSSACPEAWCEDGDVSTVDICELADDGSAACSHTFESNFESLTCLWGDYCCDDGLFHGDCDSLSTESCPASWCNDGDTATIDTCSAFVLPGSFECHNGLDPAQLGDACLFGTYCCAGVIAATCDSTASGDGSGGDGDGGGGGGADDSPTDKSANDDSAADDSAADDTASAASKACDPDWCNDGDAATVDTCTQTGSEVSCDHALDSSAIGAACTFGEHCCHGVIAAGTCAPGGVDCPTHDWCNDGDKTTLDTCSLYDPTQGTFECSHVFDTSTDGTDCSSGEYCCFGRASLECAEDGPGADCPDGWCNDGDLTTTDTCSHFKVSEFECTNVFNTSVDGTACMFGLYCCNGAVAETCSDQAPAAEPESGGGGGGDASDTVDPFEGTCTIDMDSSCPLDGAICGSTFTGGMCTTAPDHCFGASSGVLEIGSSEQVEIQFSQDVQAVTVLFAHSSGAGGIMMFLDSDGGMLGLVTSKGGCESSKPARVAVSFSKPARSMIMSATGGSVYVDDLRLTTP